ncbi:MAG: DUF4288 domain-containing protein [Sphingobacteriales bacterium]|nr:MAG: DUF4288 domain-containing protein [Sphingobacteriales bacterium]
MQAYTAQAIYRIKCEGVKSEQYEEQWRIVYADDDIEALTKARNIAADEEVTFADRHGRIINWELVAIKDLQPIELKQGGLLFSVLREIEPIAAPVWAE